MNEKELLEAIKAHTEHWKDVNGYDCPYDYIGLRDIIHKHNVVTVEMDKFNCSIEELNDFNKQMDKFKEKAIIIMDVLGKKELVTMIRKISIDEIKNHNTSR